MKIKFLPFLLLFIVISQQSIGQHIDIDKKVLAFLTSEEKINIEFTYKGLLFNEDSIPEPVYLKEIEVKVKEKYGDQGFADWMDKYNDSKNELWPQTFMTTLNEKLQEYKHKPQFELNNPDAEYTMKVNTSWLYFGYNVVAAKWPSKIRLELEFYKTADPDHLIFSTRIKRAMGTNNESYNLDGWSKFRRVGKAYKKAAYKLAQALKRVVD